MEQCKPGGNIWGTLASGAQDSRFDDYGYGYTQEIADRVTKTFEQLEGSIGCPSLIFISIPSYPKSSTLYPKSSTEKEEKNFEFKMNSISNRLD